jgi:hypothetical protein
MSKRHSFSDIERRTAAGQCSSKQDVRRALWTDINPRVPEGPHVWLEPLTLSHADAFYEAGREWNLTREAVKSGIESALREQALGSALPFATVDRNSTQVVGGTRFFTFA